MLGDVMGVMRRYPMVPLLIGLGVGYVLARSSRPGGILALRARRAEDTEPQARAAGYPDAMIQCSRCGELVRQADMVRHSATCTGQGLPSHGGTP